VLAIGRILIGVLLLVLGRRLYWLFVAGVGFVYGLELAPRLLPGYSDAVIVIAALALALVGALVAVLATKVAVGLIGFAAGGGIAVLLLEGLGIGGGTALALGIYLVAGVIGAVLLILVFDGALIALSSLAGAVLIATSLERLLDMPPAAAAALAIVLAVIGALIQTGLGRLDKPSR
jgi:hypothetical protein